MIQCVRVYILGAESMKYKNASSILPQELVELIQEYVQGKYIYIPVRDKYVGESATEYKNELEKRDAHIYINYLEGMSNKCLSEIYHLSESSIRRIIIKQRKGYTEMNDNIRNLLFHWGLQNCQVKQIYNSTWQVGEEYVLKVYENIEGLERNLKILHILGEMNIPVGKVVPANDKKQYIASDNVYYFMSKKLLGNNIVRIGNDMSIAVTMGEIIADLHMAFKKCEDADVFWNNSLLEEMNGWVKSNLESSGWKHLGKEEYEKVISQLATVYDELPVQLIHRDVHFGNFLFSEGNFSGYIDFDLSQKNIRIFDLCYFLLGLLSEEEKLEITKERWFEFVKNVFLGYEKKLELYEAEKKAVPYVMECIELLFVAYFDSVNDVGCAENAYKLFEFVKNQKKRIWKSIQ